MQIIDLPVPSKSEHLSEEKYQQLLNKAIEEQKTVYTNLQSIQDYLGQ